jgi:hypothetical protein
LLINLIIWHGICWQGVEAGFKFPQSSYSFYISDLWVAKYFLDLLLLCDSFEIEVVLDLLAEWNACAGETLALNSVDIFEGFNDVGIWMVQSCMNRPPQILDAIVMPVEQLRLRKDFLDALF